jgi:hypothetical protein
MLKTIIIVALIAGAILASVAFCAYVLKVDFATDIMNKITQPFSGISAGGKLDLQSVASAASLATAATSAVGWIKSNKDKVLAQKQALEQQVQNSGLKEQYESLTNTKSELEGQITELTQQKDDAIAEAKESANTIANLESQVKKLRQTVDIYNTETIPNLKQKIIEKTIVK